MLVLEKARIEEHPTCSLWHDGNIATTLQEIRNGDQTFRMRIHSRVELQTSLTKKQCVGASSTSVSEEWLVKRPNAKWEARLKYVDVVLMRWPDAHVHTVSAPNSTGKRKATVVNSLSKQATDKRVVGEKVSTTEEMAEGNKNTGQMQEERGEESSDKDEEFNEDQGQENNKEGEEDKQDKGGSGQENSKEEGDKGAIVCRFPEAGNIVSSFQFVTFKSRYYMNIQIIDSYSHLFNRENRKKMGHFTRFCFPSKLTEYVLVEVEGGEPHTVTSELKFQEMLLNAIDVNKVPYRFGHAFDKCELVWYSV
ncbi:hypothetical protein LINPERPRIM_LOCUS24787 [Linum perenne]